VEQESFDDAAAKFDWTAHWYPVQFSDNVPLDQPTRVTLFDKHYVIARRSKGGPVALLDRCSHRAAALSEGLLTPDGCVQCPYHGWAFEGETGQCTNVPQLSPGAMLSKRTNVQAFPIREYQGMLWLRPSGDPAEVNREPDNAKELPGVSELDREGWVANDFIRDFHIDYTLLLENLMDPDHGLFAHQAPYFDLYSANKDHPMHVTLTTNTDTNDAPLIVATTTAVEKLTAGSPEVVKKQEKEAKGKGKGKGEVAVPLRSTIRFQAPVHLRWSRLDEAGKTKTFTAFWAVPTGVGRSRLMLRFLRSSGTWLRVPTWLFSIATNAFVDQDSYLLATQQAYTLGTEALALKEKGKKGIVLKGSKQDDGATVGRGSPHSEEAAFPTKRKNVFCYSTPSDSLQMAAGRWIDNAVPRMPRRTVDRLLTHSSQGALVDDLPQSKRESVLDRWEGHTKVCASSMTAFKFFKAARTVLAAAAVAGAAALLAYAVLRAQMASAVQLTAGLATVPSVLAVGFIAALAYGCHWIMRKFRYIHTEAVQRKQLSKIAGLTAHLRAKLSGATGMSAPKMGAPTPAVR